MRLVFQGWHLASLFVVCRLVAAKTLLELVRFVCLHQGWRQQLWNNTGGKLGRLLSLCLSVRLACFNVQFGWTLNSDWNWDK